MAASKQDLVMMQESLLKAVLLGEPLLGTTDRIVMPDLSFVTAGPTILLLNENLYGPVDIASGAKPIQVISPFELRQSRESSEQAGYLRFAPSTIALNSVQMVLQARLLTDASGNELGLSALQVDFRKSGDRWIASSPVISAM